MRWPFNESALRTLRWEVGRGFGSTRASAGSDGPGVGAGRVGVGPGSGRAKLRSGWSGSNFGSGRVGFGDGLARGQAGLGPGRASSGRVGPGRVGFGPGSGVAGLRTTKAPRGSKTSSP